MSLTTDDVLSPALRGAPPKAIELAWKFAKLLGLHSTPDLVIRNNLSSKWLGRIHFGGPGFPRPRNLMEIQKKVLHDERTLSRVVAHEMCHHAEFLEMLEKGRSPTSLYRKYNPSHGRDWQAFADKVNRAMGQDFVTVVSDASVTRGELAPKTRKYLMRISWVGAQIAYAISAKLTPKTFGAMTRAFAYEEYTKRKETRYILLDDARWAHGTVPNIGSMKISIPRNAEEVQALEELYAKAAPLAKMYPALATAG